MSAKKTKDILSTGKLKGKLDWLSKLEQSSRSHEFRKRLWYVPYLDAVLSLYAKARSKHHGSSKIARRVAEITHAQARRRKHAIHMIIETTSKVDPKTKSRWSAGLRWAYRERGEWDDLEEFLRRRGKEPTGGISGCAAKFRAHYKKELEKRKAEDEGDDW